MTKQFPEETMKRLEEITAVEGEYMVKMTKN